MLRFLLSSMSVGLLACGDGGPSPCDRDETAVGWSAVHSTYGSGQTITGTISLPDGRTLRDDRMSGRQIDFDSYSLSSRVTLGARLDGALVATIVLPSPTEEGTFALESIGAELAYCDDPAPFGYGSDACTHRSALHGSIVVRPKPSFESGPSAYAYAFRLDATADDGATIDLDVIAAFWTQYTAPCRGGQ